MGELNFFSVIDWFCDLAFVYFCIKFDTSNPTNSFRLRLVGMVGNAFNLQINQSRYNAPKIN